MDILLFNEPKGALNMIQNYELDSLTTQEKQINDTYFA